MPSPPLLTTPFTSSPTAVCKDCGTPLIRTGQVVTFAETPKTTASKVEGRLVRGHAAYKGWVPTLFVNICPTCDGHTERPDDEPDLPEPAPSVNEVMESYLERLGRLHDEAQQEDGA
jgi:hypothetical protein